MADLIKVNGMYYRCMITMYLPESLYFKVKVTEVDTEHGTVSYYFVNETNETNGDDSCSIDMFQSNFAETKKGAFEKEIAKAKERLRKFKMKLEDLEKEGCKE